MNLRKCPQTARQTKTTKEATRTILTTATMTHQHVLVARMQQLPLLHSNKFATYNKSKKNSDDNITSCKCYKTTNQNNINFTLITSTTTSMKQHRVSSLQNTIFRVSNAGNCWHVLRFSLFCVLFNLMLLLLSTDVANGQLLINVQNQGGEVIQESITSNISEDLITLEFQKTDGTLITQVIDFRNEVRIMKALVLGEEERGQSQYQVMCFATKFIKGDFISSDAMAKLRQKNPHTIRTPEEDKGRETFIMTSWVQLNRSFPITRHLQTLCAEAADATYVRDLDLRAWAELPGSSISSLEAATERFPVALSSLCNEVSSLWAPCLCTLETCIGWYPCGLKYCKGKNSNAANGGADTSQQQQQATNYRCGIKTCRKCTQFTYYVRQKQQCLWDE